jgi:hypothetical protein
MFPFPRQESVETKTFCQRRLQQRLNKLAISSIPIKPGFKNFFIRNAQRYCVY